MGATLMKTGDEEVGEVPANNGLMFKDFYMPPEVVVHILSFLDPVLKGRLVCKVWRDMIESPMLWREKVLREVPGASPRIFHPELDWKDYYHVYARKPHKRNLIRNGSAKDDLKYWSVGGSSYGGSKWKIEKEPIGCEPFPPGLSRCFVTSFSWCSAEQIINLRKCGLTPNFMKHVQPNIYIEEWHTGRFDCGFNYNLNVTLLSINWDVIDTFPYSTEGHTTEWTKISHCFSNYDREVAAVVFTHKGKDNQFWAGNYGCKMTGAKVYITLPGYEE